MKKSRCDHGDARLEGLQLAVESFKRNTTADTSDILARAETFAVFLYTGEIFEPSIQGEVDNQTFKFTISQKPPILTKKTGYVNTFNQTTWRGTVLFEDGLLQGFHSIDFYCGSPTRLPLVNEPVEVLYQNDKFIMVRVINDEPRTS